MPFAGIQIARRVVKSGGGGETGDGDGILPYIGVADWNAPRTGETILSLRQLQRGANPSVVAGPFSVQLDGNDGLFMAYPKIYGLARFKSMDRSGSAPPYTYTDTWDMTMDGAHGDPVSGPYGPVEEEIVIDGIRIPFYIYVNDWPGLGLFHFRMY